MCIECALHRGGQRLDVLLSETGMAHDDFAVASDDVARGHAANFVSFGELPLRIEEHPKIGGVAREESIRFGTILIDVYRYDHETLRPEVALQLVHERKRLSAGSAPGCPKVEIDDFPFKVCRGEFIGVRRQCAQQRAEQSKCNDPQAAPEDGTKHLLMLSRRAFDSAPTCFEVLQENQKTISLRQRPFVGPSNPPFDFWFRLYLYIEK